MPAGVNFPVKFVAFYLPQFHPTPENDLWWGRGFTEWINVTKARPLFDGHYQPHLPTDLGFYDLRLRQSRRDQSELAKASGIDAFCYHYYWFSGKRVLYEPLEGMLADDEQDMPFCLCWANENWTRRWDAAEHEILLKQNYGPEDDLEFIKSVIPYFRDRRYLKKNGAPILLVYRPQHLPDSEKTLSIWREHCRSIGFPDLHLVCALTHGNDDYEKYGFDTGVQFPPHSPSVTNHAADIDFQDSFHGTVLNYAEIAESYLRRPYPESSVYKCVFPSWDNTARTGPRSLITLNGTPQNYEFWLKEATRMTEERFDEDAQFVFINAWNEWAEGCHLEPDRKYGCAFLEATLRVKSGRSTVSKFEDVSIPATRPAVTQSRTLHQWLNRVFLRVRRPVGTMLRRWPRLHGFAVKLYNRVF